MNSVILMGRLTADPEIKETSNGHHVCRFTVAVDRMCKEEKTADFIPCVAFHKNAENISTYFSKGNKIAIIGNIKTGSYQNSKGDTVYTTDIWVDRFEFLESKNNNSPARDIVSKARSNGVPTEEFSEVISDGDLPF